MTTYSIALDLERPSSLDTREMLIREVQRGLLRRPRSLPPWMFYDARGSRLFERITTTPGVLPHAHGAQTSWRGVAMRSSLPLVLTNQKLPCVLLSWERAPPRRPPSCSMLPRDCRVKCCTRRWTYLPMRLRCLRDDRLALPEVCVSPIVANYVTHPPQLESFDGTTLGLYIGSSIGNFSPEEARTILRNLGLSCKPVMRCCWEWTW